MPDWTTLWENERHRWSYMTNVQLERRLRKIKKPEKLACFFEMCRRRRDYHLYDEAEERAAELGIRMPPVPTYVFGSIDEWPQPDRRVELQPKQTEPKKKKKKKSTIRVIRFKGKEK